ncbi:MAG: HNH endonuclease [Leptolyngbya sp. BL-A-14]
MNEESINPGEQLQVLLKQLFPPDSAGKTTFITRIDDAVSADGALAELIYCSTINYVARRLIFTAEFLNRKLQKLGVMVTGEMLNSELRSYVRNYINVKDKDLVEKIVSLLKQCVEARKKSIKSEKRKAIRRNTKQRSEGCYICGCGLSFNRVEKEEDENGINKDNSYESWNYPEIEHIWPRSMGGLTEDRNLKVSCKKCNRYKEDFVDASDFHYEQLFTVSDEDDENFATELNRRFEIAVWARNKFKCSFCQKPASQVGELKLVRNDKRDSWHFLNMDSYCQICCLRINKGKR